MKNWEHLVEEYCNSPDNNQWEPSSWYEYDYLVEKGKEGWELCNVIERYGYSDTIRTCYVYYWKREIEAGKVIEKSYSIDTSKSQ